MLVVDDNVPCRRAAADVVRHADGFELTGTARSGEEAVRLSETLEPDLILLDVIMPDADGGEVAARLRTHEKLRNVPIVFLTAAVSKQELDGPSGLIGGRVFVAKPVNKRELVEIIERELGAPAS